MPFTLNTMDLSVTPVADTAECVVTLFSPAAGVSVRVYYHAWNPQAAGVVWVSGGTGVTDIDGVANITFATGYGRFVFVAATADNVQLSLAVFRAVIDPAAVSVWEACADAVLAYVQGLSLTGLTADKITKQRWSRAIKTALPSVPCGMVCPFDREDIPNVLNSVDDITYPVAVIFADASNRESLQNMTRDMVWRATVSAAFRFQRLNGVESVVNCLIRPLALAAADTQSLGNVSAGGLLFYFVSREPRGV